MTETEVYEKVISNLNHLEKFIDICVICCNNLLTKIVVGNVAEQVSVTRNEKRITVKFASIRKACAVLSKGKPISLDVATAY